MTAAQWEEYKHTQQAWNQQAYQQTVYYPSPYSVQPAPLHHDYPRTQPRPQPQLRQPHNRQPHTKGPRSPRLPTREPLDPNLIKAGVIVWLHKPSDDPLPTLQCCRSHDCRERTLNEGGFNHPFLVLDHFKTPGSGAEDDSNITLTIVPVSSSFLDHESPLSTL